MNTTNSSPTSDGALTPYVSPGARRSQGWQGRQAIFVNGIQNTSEDHKKAALRVSSVIEGKVIGTYNMMRPRKFGTLVEFVRQYRDSIPSYLDSIKPDCNATTKVKDPVSLKMVGAVIQDANCTINLGAQVVAAVGHDYAIAPGTRVLLTALEKILSGLDAVQSIAVDLGQCGLDILNLHLHKLAGTEVQLLATQFPEAFKNIICGYFRSVNPAVGALLELLAYQAWPTKRCAIVAHSQGNLVTSCALSALECLNLGSCRPYLFTGPMQVFAVASPAYRWPNCGATIKTYSHIGDPVTMLSGGRSQLQLGAGKEAGGSVIEGGWSHGFDTYLTDTGELTKDLRTWMSLQSPNMCYA